MPVKNFKITPLQGQVTVLYRFDGVTGAFPSGGLTLGSGGLFMARRSKMAHRITGLSSKSLLAGNSQSCTPSTAPTARAHGERRSRARTVRTTELLNTGDRRNAALSTALLPQERSRLFITSTDPTVANPLRHWFSGPMETSMAQLWF